MKFRISFLSIDFFLSSRVIRDYGKNLINHLLSKMPLFITFSIQNELNNSRND